MSGRDAIHRIVAPRQRETVGVGVEQAPCDARRDHRVSAGDRTNRREQVRRLRIFEQEATGARSQCRVHVLVQVEGGEDDHTRIAPGVHDPPRRLDAIELRHAHVHQHHVGRKRLHLGHRVEPVRSLPRDLEVLLALDHHAERHPHQLLIVDQ